MGYAYYTVSLDGEQIEAGYSVEATCDEPECTTAIDRGLYYLCGQEPGGSEDSCGHYFCDAHMFFALNVEGQRCGPCSDRLDSEDEDEDGERLATAPSTTGGE